MHASMNNAGALIAGRFGLAGLAVVAGGAGDNVEANGAFIDRRGYNSLKVLVPYTATLGDADTLSLAANVQSAADAAGTGATDYGEALASAVQATGGGGGSTETGVLELDYDLSGCGPFVRVQVIPDLSAANTDTADLAAVYVLAGATDNPVSSSPV
ncbi:hypothetical protein [Nisaea nitritireducens]|uniref:hypothetical protein n=1 Tax=Nisaea nitritireducens TaxID=568392 RepID=UPI0018671D23|nr:hypothetical protein [Nisaea nitritireducens]